MSKKELYPVMSCLTDGAGYFQFVIHEEIARYLQTQTPIQSTSAIEELTSSFRKALIKSSVVSTLRKV
jgi:hypothetical protein